VHKQHPDGEYDWRLVMPLGPGGHLDIRRQNEAEVFTPDYPVAGGDLLGPKIGREPYCHGLTCVLNITATGGACSFEEAREALLKLVTGGDKLLLKLPPFHGTQRSRGWVASKQGSQKADHEN
jgi:hypothetical protein